MVREMLAVGLALALAVPALVVGQGTPDPELAEGISLTQTGEFESAVVILDTVAKRLAAQGGRPKELARAYVYLSIAYLGLSQEQKAKAEFLDAWKTDPGIELTAREFPPKVLKFFEKTKAEAQNSPAPEPEAKRTTTTRPPVVTESPVPVTRETAAPATNKGGGSKTLIVVAGAGAVAAGLAAAAGGGGGSGPAATPSVAPTAAPSAAPNWVPLSRTGTTATVTFLSASAASGSTVRCSDGLLVQAQVRALVEYRGDQGVVVNGFGSGGQIILAGNVHQTLPAGQSITVAVRANCNQGRSGEVTQMEIATFSNNATIASTSDRYSVFYTVTP